MEKIILAPSVNVNDDYVLISEWYYKCGDSVKSNSLICCIETTKSNLDVEAEFEGFLFYKINTGETLKVGEPLAIISDNPNCDYESLLSVNVLNNDTNNEGGNFIKWTLKAEKLCEKHQLSKFDIENYYRNETIINEIKVNEFLERSDDKKTELQADNKTLKTDIADSIYLSNKQERVLILGAGGGAVLAIDIITRNPKQRVVGILDNNSELHHKTLLGVPILGDFELIEKLWNSNFFDGVISTIVKDPSEREKIYLDLIKKGINFTNVISENANIRLNVKIGTGNLVISGAYFAPCVSIGNNNFFAAECSIEHHSKVGNNCLFGPRFTASGAVDIEDNCKFGMGVLVEPYIKIGNNSLIASGSVITNHIKENSVVQNPNQIKVVSKLK
jgi:sugar O-acyltransferase (sialic acid O-acetyltransferase NeuD family)